MLELAGGVEAVDHQVAVLAVVRRDVDLVRRRVDRQRAVAAEVFALQPGQFGAEALRVGVIARVPDAGGGAEVFESGDEAIAAAHRAGVLGRLVGAIVLAEVALGHAALAWAAGASAGQFGEALALKAALAGGA